MTNKRLGPFLKSILLFFSQHSIEILIPEVYWNWKWCSRPTAVLSRSTNMFFFSNWNFWYWFLYRLCLPVRSLFTVDCLSRRISSCAVHLEIVLWGEIRKESFLRESGCFISWNWKYWRTCSLHWNYIHTLLSASESIPFHIQLVLT